MILHHEPVIADRLMRTSSSLSLPALCDIDVGSDLDTLPEGFPSRTPSRLGFNAFTAPPPKEAEGRISGTLQWTRSLFQRISLDGYAEQEALEEEATSLSPSSSSEETDDDDDDNDSSSSDSSDNATESDHLFFPHPPRSLLHQSPITSPIRPGRPLRPTPDRYNYPHRGLSRSALIHQKWFWHTRHEVWLDCDRRQEAYSGLQISRTHRGPLSLSQRATQQSIPVSRPQPAPAAPAPAAVIPNCMSPMSIYPRSGDISALRDPFSATIDQCFCQFPIWTIHKSLFMFDMHHRATSRSVQRDVEGCEQDVEPVDSNLECVELDIGATDEDEASPKSATFSEADSDVTLVDEDSDGSYDSKSTPGELNVSPYAWDGVRAWEVTWYARWQLLVELVKRDDAFIKRDDMIVMPCAPVAPPPPTHTAEPPHMFYFAGENGDDDDDEEDYGTLVDTPLFTRMDICPIAF